MNRRLDKIHPNAKPTEKAKVIHKFILGMLRSGPQQAYRCQITIVKHSRPDETVTYVTDKRDICHLFGSANKLPPRAHAVSGNTAYFTGLL